MKIDQMPRRQIEALAFRLGMTRPDSYTMPELKAAVKKRYSEKMKQKGG